MSADRPFVSVAIPAHNEQSNLPSTVRVLLERLPAIAGTFELLVVDDASRDGTGEIADRLAADDPRVRAFHHPENRGIGGGFVTALEHSRGEWFLLIPADLALDPEDLAKYFEASPDADVVIGVRSDKRDYGPFRRLVSWTNARMIRGLFQMRERQFQYISLYRTRLLREVGIEFWRSAFFLPEILIKAKARGARSREVFIRYVPRHAGRATGARLPLIARTARDMLVFWWRGDWRQPRRT
ncbi:MAG TPA: glycosyltransferase family 2 protein [Thermoanaerobaculia bacterium]|jgi:glycosyltransferase involved in cell wall biosynthesis|nr:glycosyltransferase family 2 protein [Thermoanaerobaculia bacterium]